MMGGTVWSSDALWNGVTLLNDAAVGVYGMILSAAFCGITWTRGKKWAYGLSMAAILLAQAAVYGMTTDLQLLKLLYPLVTHMPLVLVLAILERKLLWPTISVLTAYLCCQLRRWLALLLTALMSGGAEVQTAAELALTLPLLLGLLYFVARWVYFNGQNIWWLGLCVALLAAKDVPLRRVMKAFLACGVPTLALVELLHFAGIIAPDAASERNGSYRLMFGYGHPNTFGGVMFGLLLAWVLLRRARLTWPELAGVAAVGVFLMIGPKSRSAALCTFLLVLLLALAKLRTRRGLHPGSRPRSITSASKNAAFFMSFLLFPLSSMNSPHF